MNLPELMTGLLRPVCPGPSLCLLVTILSRLSAVHCSSPCFPSCPGLLVELQLMLIHPFTDIHHARYQPARQEQFGFRCLAQGHFDTTRAESNRLPSDCQTTALTSWATSQLSYMHPNKNSPFISQAVKIIPSLPAEMHQGKGILQQRQLAVFHWPSHHS